MFSGESPERRVPIHSGNIELKVNGPEVGRGTEAGDVGNDEDQKD